MLRAQRLEFPDEAQVTAEREVGVDAVFQCPESALLQSGCLRPRERRVADIGEHRAAPQRQRFTEDSRRRFGVTLTQGSAAALGQLLEGSYVQRVVGTQLEDVSRLLGADGPIPAAGKSFSESRDADPDRVERRPRGVSGPQILDQPVHRYRPSDVQKEPGQEGSLEGAAEIDVRANIDRLDRTQDPVLHPIPLVTSVFRCR
jgi:hypothetical protein